MQTELKTPADEINLVTAYNDKNDDKLNSIAQASLVKGPF